VPEFVQPHFSICATSGLRIEPCARWRRARESCDRIELRGELGCAPAGAGQRVEICEASDGTVRPNAAAPATKKRHEHPKTAIERRTPRASIVSMTGAEHFRRA